MSIKEHNGTKHDKPLTRDDTRFYRDNAAYMGHAASLPKGTSSTSMRSCMVSILLVQAMPSTLMRISLGDTVLLSLIMGATGAIPSFDDAYTDVAIVLVLTFLT